jgi:hypothetical protein
MPFPPETPQDYCDYFQSMTLNAKPPNPKWGIGLKAAQMWQEYFEKDNVRGNSQLLIPLVKILMPVSNSGSILLDLWQQILRHVAKLSASEQKEIWLEVFNVINQGRVSIKHNEEAQEILDEWTRLDKTAGTTQITERTMTDMVNKISKYTFSSWEWIAFTVAISEWFKKYIAEPSLYDLVCGRFEKKVT